MAVPFRKTSKQAKRKRRTHFKLSALALGACKNCASPIKPHHVCQQCGFYKGEEIIKIEKK